MFFELVLFQFNVSLCCTILVNNIGDFFSMSFEPKGAEVRRSIAPVICYPSEGLKPPKKWIFIPFYKRKWIRSMKSKFNQEMPDTLQLMQASSLG